MFLQTNHSFYQNNSAVNLPSIHGLQKFKETLNVKVPMMIVSKLGRHWSKEYFVCLPIAIYEHALLDVCVHVHLQIWMVDYPAKLFCVWILFSWRHFFSFCYGKHFSWYNCFENCCYPTFCLYIFSFVDDFFIHFSLWGSFMSLFPYDLFLFLNCQEFS